MGIVDFLQDWNMRKRVERALKIYVNRQDPGGISVMKPLPYRDRFQHKMAEIFDLEDYHEDELNHRLSASIRGSRRHHHQQQLESTPPYRFRSNSFSRSRSNSFTPEAISGTVMSLFRMNPPSSNVPNEHSEVELSILRHSDQNENHDNDLDQRPERRESLLQKETISEEKGDGYDEEEGGVGMGKGDNNGDDDDGLPHYMTSSSPKIKENHYQQLEEGQDNFL